MEDLSCGRCAMKMILGLNFNIKLSNLIGGIRKQVLSLTNLANSRNSMDILGLLT